MANKRGDDWMDRAKAATPSGSEARPSTSQQPKERSKNVAKTDAEWAEMLAVGVTLKSQHPYIPMPLQVLLDPEVVERILSEVRAEEREACAKIADEWATKEQREFGNGGPAAAIRARSRERK